MAKKAEKTPNFVEKLQKNAKFIKIRAFLEKYNPFKETRQDKEYNKILDSQAIRNYRDFTVWLIELHLIGLPGSFILWQLFSLPFNYGWILSVGLAAWLGEIVWEKYVEGKIRINK